MQSAATQVEETDQIMLITDAGSLVRTRASEVSIVGRNTQGVALIRTADERTRSKFRNVFVMQMKMIGRKNGRITG